MSVIFDPFTGQIIDTGSNTGGGGSSGIPTYANAAALPSSAADGTQAVTLDTHTIYVYNAGTSTWQPVSGSSTPFHTEYHTITSGENAAKHITLAFTPSTFVSMDVISGGPQQIITDFSVSGNTLSWNGLALDGILATGDILRIEYFA
jgi:hypothetical protein